MKPCLPVVAVSLVLGGCVGVDTIDDFRGAVRAGASCQELFDQRSNFSDPATLTTIDAELREVGCHDPSSTRTDR